MIGLIELVERVEERIEAEQNTPFHPYWCGPCWYCGCILAQQGKIRSLHETR